MPEKTGSIFMKLKKFLAGLAVPVSLHEDDRRREFILNILLLASITLLTIAMVSSVITSLSASIEDRSNNALSLAVLVGILCLFFGLYALSQHGRSKTASFVLLAIFFLLGAYLAYRWGPDLPSAILFYALTIVMSGILINSRFAFGVTIALTCLAALLNHLQTVGAIPLNAYWRTENLTLPDTIVYGVMLLIIATVSWLANRETERSLKRARHSEAVLMEERDLLEVRVEERTKELRKAEVEKMSQTYRFVEFGRLASGLFHDLTNPLTALSLNIESIARSHGTEDPEQVALLTEDVARARSATHHMQKLMESMRRYLAREGRQEIFSLNRSLEEMVHILEPYARQREVHLALDTPEPIEMMGDPVALIQVLTNLVSNAVESFPREHGQGVSDRTVTITLSRSGNNASIQIRDTGQGIPDDMLVSIFEPFVSTKGSSGGLGIGLSLAKRIIEKEFDGTITVESTVGEGATFTVYFPLREP